MRRITSIFLTVTLAMAATIAAAVPFGARPAGPFPQPLRTVDAIVLIALILGLCALLGLTLLGLQALARASSGTRGTLYRRLAWRKQARARPAFAARTKARPDPNEAPHIKLVREALEQAQQEALQRCQRPETRKSKRRAND